MLSPSTLSVSQYGAREKHIDPFSVSKKNKSFNFGSFSKINLTLSAVAKILPDLFRSNSASHFVSSGNGVGVGIGGVSSFFSSSLFFSNSEVSFCIFSYSSCDLATAGKCLTTFGKLILMNSVIFAKVLVPE